MYQFSPLESTHFIAAAFGVVAPLLLMTSQPPPRKLSKDGWPHPLILLARMILAGYLAICVIPTPDLYQAFGLGLGLEGLVKGFQRLTLQSPKSTREAE